MKSKVAREMIVDAGILKESVETVETTIFFFSDSSIVEKVEHCIFSFHDIQTCHRFKFDVCYPSLIPNHSAKLLQAT